uniref:Histone RNA hairpin-binding protein n=1 Tax=Salmo salar TaxID=8030 RepID=B5X925_SALSA|nr:Histone RNA hairpin-binding protein [Salmo salar]
MSFRHKSRRTDAEYNGDENRNRGPSRWSNCRKRGADGSMRSNGDLDSTGTSDLKINPNHRPVSFTTPESEGPVPRCADWGSEVETDERRSSVRRDMQRYRRRILTSDFGPRERKNSSGSSESRDSPVPGEVMEEDEEVLMRRQKQITYGKIHAWDPPALEGSELQAIEEVDLDDVMDIELDFPELDSDSSAQPLKVSKASSSQPESCQGTPSKMMKIDASVDLDMA